MKILVVMGTRPEAIKLAPVVAALRRRGFKTLICSTGQHRELLDAALRPFGLRSVHDLKAMRPGQTPNALAKRIFAALGPLLKRVKPGMLVVQGDTTTAAAAAVCASERGIPVAHVEAGLRSYDFSDPFPEELNRVAVDLLASLLFPPTPAARANLERERLGGRTVITTGNTVVDALRRLGRGARAARGAREVLVTLHRREIHGAPFRRVCAALLSLVEKHPDLTLVFPVHPNPAVARDARRLLRHPRVRLLQPLPYSDFIRALERSLFVITDSGGVQEEAASLGKPVLIAREKTERPEVLACGAGRLVGRGPARLTLWAERLLARPALRRKMSRVRNPYGDGRAAERVAAGVAFWFGLGRRPADWRP